MSIGKQLSSPVFVRTADPKEEPVEQWLQANSARNGFDPAVLKYPTTKILAGHNNGSVYAYMPVQAVAMLESIGPNPEATPLQVAQAVLEIVKGACLMAYDGDCREAYFLASDGVTAEGAKLLGFEEMPYKVYRARLK